ncbi:hypothetical protein [Actinomadura barringtoniae]|uniref:hypothetical protein n=1 Tax=Actinomadura barringtoniae TaxID=1427535 RepID=UPI001FB619C9|nr:hypothetical protein [Actinomadura barringtoniae]
MTATQGAGGFEPPGTGIFQWGPLIPGGPHWLTKPVLIVLLSAAIVCVFFWSAFRRPQQVPRGMQNVGELAYLFVRDQIARPTIGRDGDA